MAADDYDEDERELIRKHRESKAKERADEFEVEVGDGKGNYARVPYGKAKNWLRNIGFEIDDEPEQDEPEPEPKPEPKKGRGQQASGGQVRAFQRRIS